MSQGGRPWLNFGRGAGNSTTSPSPAYSLQQAHGFMAAWARLPAGGSSDMSVDKFDPNMYPKTWKPFSYITCWSSKLTYYICIHSIHLLFLESTWMQAPFNKSELFPSQMDLNDTLLKVFHNSMNQINLWNIATGTTDTSFRASLVPWLLECVAVPLRWRLSHGGRCVHRYWDHGSHWFRWHHQRRRPGSEERDGTSGIL